MGRFNYYYFISFIILYCSNSWCNVLAWRDLPCYGAQTVIHSNGGGLVALSARVAPSVFLGPQATVCDDARVTGNVIIEGKVKIAQNARVSGNVKINGSLSDFSSVVLESYGNSVLNQRTRGVVISGNSRVSGNVEIKGHVLISNWARLKDDVLVDGRYMAIYGNAKIEDMAHLRGILIVEGNAVVKSRALLESFTMEPILRIRNNEVIQ